MLFQPWSPLFVSLLGGTAIGASIGLVHFLSLSRVAGLFLDGGVFLAVALQFVRLLFLIVALLFLAKLGAAALLAGTGSLVLARTAILRFQWSAG
jgi:hypothetical protein